MTCGPEPTTRSAPASTAVWANPRVSPRSSPKGGLAILRVMWVCAAPSPPACMIATTTSAWVELGGLCLRSRAPRARSLIRCFNGVGREADPSATWRSLYFSTVIWPGRPTLREPRLGRAPRIVSRRLPYGAVVERVVVGEVERVEPGWFESWRAYVAGAWKEKQVGVPAVALARAALSRERALEVAGHEVGSAQGVPDVREQGRAAVRGQPVLRSGRDVPDPPDRDRPRAAGRGPGRRASRRPRRRRHRPSPSGRSAPVNAPARIVATASVGASRSTAGSSDRRCEARMKRSAIAPLSPDVGRGRASGRAVGLLRCATDRPGTGDGVAGRSLRGLRGRPADRRRAPRSPRYPAATRVRAAVRTSATSVSRCSERVSRCRMQARSVYHLHRRQLPVTGTRPHALDGLRQYRVETRAGLLPDQSPPGATRRRRWRVCGSAGQLPSSYPGWTSSPAAGERVPRAPPRPRCRLGRAQRWSATSGGARNGLRLLRSHCSGKFCHGRVGGLLSAEGAGGRRMNACAQLVAAPDSARPASTGAAEPLVEVEHAGRSGRSCPR